MAVHPVRDHRRADHDSAARVLVGRPLGRPADRSLVGNLQRLHPDHRNFPILHAEAAPCHHLVLALRHLPRHHALQLAVLGPRHQLRTARLQGLRPRPRELQLDPDRGSLPADDPHPP